MDDVFCQTGLLATSFVSLGEKPGVAARKKSSYIGGKD